MKYSELIQFNPIESVIKLTSANEQEKAIELVKTYVMSDEMVNNIKYNMISQLKLEDAIDSKGIFLIGNYGTGKSHLMSLISSVAEDENMLNYVQNKKFIEEAKSIAGKFETLRIEIGATKMSLRNIIFQKIKEDFKIRGLDFEFPDEKDVINNKGTIKHMMELFNCKYPGKGYLLVVDELLDYLRSRKTIEVRLSLGFMRELGEIAGESNFRVIFGLQEKLFNNPNFSFVSETLNQIKERYEQVAIQKNDTAYVVSERILKKTPEQKSIIREHLQKFTSLYNNMSADLESYVELYPIHPAYIDVFNKIYLIENRAILKNITEIIRRNFDNEISDEIPGIISFDSYWQFIKENLALHTDVNIKQVVDASESLEDIIKRSFPKKQYKLLALQIMNALSVHRLTTGDITIKSGLTAENLRDDLCLYIKGLPDQSSDTMQSIVQVVLRDIMTTVSGQFIEHNDDNGQYYLDTEKVVDYDEKIIQKAATIDDDKINNYFYDVIYYCMEWDQGEYVTNFKIYEHSLNWYSHNIFRRGYLFLGTPESRPTAQPPEDYYIYFVPPYGNDTYVDEKKDDEVFFIFKSTEEFKNELKLYSAALMLRDISDEKSKPSYKNKADNHKKKLIRYLNQNKNTCFDVIYKGDNKQLLSVMKENYKKENPFKETLDLVASLCLDEYFNKKYPEFPIFKTNITKRNQADAIRAAIDRFAGRKNQQANLLLESFGVINEDKVSSKYSKYTAFYIEELNKLSQNSVINFLDIYEESFSEYLDKQFKISYAWMPVIFISMVYSGNAVLMLKNGTLLTASNLDILPKTNVSDIYEFKYLCKPKDIRLAELIRLYEILGIPVGLINNPSERESGLNELLKKAEELSLKAAKGKSIINNNFTLWGEPLIAEHISSKYTESCKNILDMFSNFKIKYNTVAKLNNFNYSIEDIEKIAEDIENINLIYEYEKFRNTCKDNINYIMNLENVMLDKSFLIEKIKSVKTEFHNFRDNILVEKDGEKVAEEVNVILTSIKKEYINYYFEEHKKRRLSLREGKRKGEIINSIKLSNLKKLRVIDILSNSKLLDIERELSSLKVCYELTVDLLKDNCFCTKCNFIINNNDNIVKGRLDNIENNIENLFNEWSKTLITTISDPLVLEQKKYLNTDQQILIDNVIKENKLPDTIDGYFIKTIQTLLEGFEPVTIDSKDLISKLDSIGPVDLATFKKKIDIIISEYTKGKDIHKLRMVVKR